MTLLAILLNKKKKHSILTFNCKTTSKYFRIVEYINVIYYISIIIEIRRFIIN